MPTYNLYDDDNEYLDDIGAIDEADALRQYNGADPDDQPAKHAQLWQTSSTIADQINPRHAQLIVAKTMALMGSEQEWDAIGITEVIAGWLKPLTEKAGLPDVSDQDDAAVRFWGSVG